MTQTIKTTDFDQQVLASDVPVLVDFWAEWCPPCRQLLPVIEKIDAASEGNYRVVKVNVDEAPELAERYGVQSIPTLIVFRDGEATETRIGLQSEAQLRDLLGV